jgi:hypothetical protein
MAANWLDLLGAAFGGGLGVKLLDYLHDEFRRRRDATRNAKQVLDTNLDPILKAADEAVGKLFSLAGSDFKELVSKRGRSETGQGSMLAVLFLVAQFWARIQILREQSVYVNLARMESGKWLLEFLKTLEAHKTRLVERASQRAMGEALIVREHDNLRCCTYFEFGEKYLSSETYRAWFAPLVVTLERLQHTRERQRLLVYGTVLHAFVDTLDTARAVTRGRPTWANKLSVRSRRDLQFRVFPLYLPFVKSARRFYRPESRGDSDSK